MKKPSFRRRNALLSNGGALAGAALLGVALLVLLLRLLFPATTIALFTPVWNVGTAASGSVGTLLDGFRSNARLAAENRMLVDQNTALTAENASLSAKDADLTKLLGTEASKQQGVAAGVIARPPESPYGALIVAAGSESGIASGDLVLAAGGVPIGSVAEVAPHTARVALFTAAGEHRDAWVGASRAPITLVGQGSSFVASVPRADTIAKGDAVYLSGPGAIPAGTVMDISGDGSAPTEDIAIAPAVNVQSVTWVLVVNQRAP